MRFNIFTIALFYVGICSPALTSATSIIPYPNLGEAAKYSQCVVLASAIDSVSTDLNGTSYRDTRFQVIASIKGDLWPNTVITIRPFSCQSGLYNIAIAGDFKPEVGKIYLLFIYLKDDCWKPTMLSFYVFEQFKIGLDEFLVPIGGDGIEVAKRPDGQAIEPLGVYYQNAFLSYLQSFVATPQAVWDGSVGRSSLQAIDFTALDRAVPTGCDFSLGGSLSRWQNPAIPVFYDDTNNPSGWGSSFTQILSALNNNYTGISPSDAGSASYVPNCGNNSAYQGNFRSFCDNNLNGAQSTLIIFDDPCNEIPDLNNCNGTLAFGGSYSSSVTHSFDGMNWQNASYGFLVVNNGAPGCLSNIGFERMMSHELTHTYRMGHLNATNYPNQNMNPTCCNAINTKDRECMNYAYPAPAPVELLSFEARKQGENQVKLKWVTASEKDNAHFTLQRSANGIQYKEIQQVASSGNSTGATYEWLDTQPLGGVNYYLLSQTDFDGKSQHLGIKSVTVEKIGNALSVFPNPIKGNNLAFEIDIPAHFDGILEVLDTDGRVLLSESVTIEKDIHRSQQSLGKIPAGVYLLRLFDGQQQWTARFLKQ